MKDLKKLKENCYIRNFLEENDLQDAFLEQHYNTFLRVAEAHERCAGCESLEECQQPSKGERLSLAYDGVLYEEIELCPYCLNRKKKDNLLDSYVYCDIGKNLVDIDLNNIDYTADQKAVYMRLSAILLGKNDRGVYISGDLGTGKTYLCTALANSLVKDGKKVAFVKVSNFFNEMRNAIGNDNELISRNINILKKADYVFFDDIGSESVSEFIRDDILFRILDYRMDNRLTTIFTSNLNKEDLLRHYQYDRKEKANLMNAKRLMERIDILSEDYVLTGNNLRRK